MMAEKVVPLRERVADSEKITINLGYVDLGSDRPPGAGGLLSNRSDFIRTAIRNSSATIPRRSPARSSGTPSRSASSTSGRRLEARGGGRDLHIRVVGLAAHRPRRHARTRARNDRLADACSARCRRPAGQGRARRPHRIAAQGGKDHAMGKEFAAAMLRATAVARPGDAEGNAPSSAGR